MSTWQRHDVVTVLAIDDVEHAHRVAYDLALDACELGKVVAHLHADPNNQVITFHADGSHDLGAAGNSAISSIPTASGRLLQIAVGGLTRAQIGGIIDGLNDQVDRILLSGPATAFTQLSLEFATLADNAIVVGGSAAEAAHLESMLDQLGIAHQPSAGRPPESSATDATAPPATSTQPAETTGETTAGTTAGTTRRITPPGRL